MTSDLTTRHKQNGAIKMKKLNMIISMLLTIFFLTSCVQNVYDKTTTEPTTTDITEQKIQIDSKKISDNFTWDDYLKHAQGEGAVIMDLENYFNAYFFVIEKFKLKSAESGDFKYDVYENNTAVISEYTGNEKDIVFPDTVDGYPVVGIGKVDFRSRFKSKKITVKTGSNTLFISGSSFDYCYGIKKVVLNEGLTVIFRSAFGFAESLTEINFPSTLKEIGDSAFYDCKKLKTLDLSKTKLRKISAGCFSECADAEKVMLPETVCRIEKEAFFRDKSLADINIPRALTEIDITALSGTRINVADFKNAGINIGDGMIWMNDKDITLNSAE